MTDSERSQFVYVTYIRTTPERLWSALTESEFMKQYWLGSHIETDWKEGSPWRLLFPDDRVADTGEVTEIDPTKRLVLKWRNEWKPEFKAEGFARCTMELEPIGDVVNPSIAPIRNSSRPSLVVAEDLVQSQVAPRDRGVVLKTKTGAG